MTRSVRTSGRYLRSVLTAPVLTLLLCAVVLLPTSMVEASAPVAQADLDWGRMPLYFVPNQGQVDEAVSYYVQGADKTIYFTPQGLTLSLASPVTPQDAVPASVAERWAIRLSYLGADEVTPTGGEQSEAVVSYFRGDRDDWQTAIPTYSSIVYEDLWEGVDLGFSGTQDQLKHEFVVAPGADPAQIRLCYEGASLSLNDQGGLEVSTPVGGFTDAAPIAYQVIAGERVAVPVRYVLDEPSGSGAGESTEYGFFVGDYDASLPLVIDPTILVYCGYIGGSGVEYGQGVAVDSSGCAYVTGYTSSTESDFPETVGPDLSHNDGDDAFVAKVGADGSALIYCGYIGGESNDWAYSIAVDPDGCAYVTGGTFSTESTFPASGGPDVSQNGSADAFVAKVNAAGTSLDYCGFIGGSGQDRGSSVALDASDCAYVTGFTGSTATTFPVSGGPDLTHNGGSYDAFVAKVSADGSSLGYCGYIGGGGVDGARAIAVDSDGCAYVTGYVASTETTFPVSGGPDLTHNGGDDAFVAKVSADGSSLAYCGYIGGSGADGTRGIAVDSSGCAYVTGDTNSTETTFPVSGGPDLTHNGYADAFVAKVNAAGTSLDYCGYIGGEWEELSKGLALDSTGCVYITGRTSSDENTFPVSGGPDLAHNGGNDAFVAKVSASGTALDYCGFIGGSSNEEGYGIAVGSRGSAYLVGITSSTEGTFPVESGPDLVYNGGSYDAFVAKIVEAGPPIMIEDFEDGDADGWLANHGSIEVVTSPSDPDGGSYVGKVMGDGNCYLPYYMFGGASPDEFSLYFRADGDTTHSSGVAVQLRGPATPGGGTYMARVSFHGSELRYCTTTSLDDPPSDLTYYTIMSAAQGTWYHIEFKNIDWTAHTFDMWVDGVQRNTGVPFLHDIDSIRMIQVYGCDSWSGPVYLDDILYRFASPLDLPTVTSISPVAGPVSGGTEVTITGTGFVDVKSVTFGGEPAAGYSVDSDTEITATAPAAATAGDVQVQVSNWDGGSADTTADDFTYLATNHYDDKDPMITYTPAWSRWDNSGYWAASSDTYGYTDKKGAKAILTFEGTSLSWMACTSNTKGRALVTVDPWTAGETEMVVDLYSPSTLWKQTVYSTGDLDYGTHTVVIECIYDKDPDSWWYTIGVDRFDIAGSLVQSPTISKVDDNEYGQCAYFPGIDPGASTTAWSRWDGSGYWAAYMDTYAYTDKDDYAITFTFEGIYASWVACTSNTKGKALVTVDGNTAEAVTVDLYSSSTLWKQNVYDTGILAAGVHTVEIECLYEKNPASVWYTIDVDRFDVLPASP